jgi:hypothetical protein
VNKTEDIEEAIRFALAREGQPITMAELVENRLSYVTEKGISRQWIGAAFYKMVDDGRIRTPGCDHDTYSHDDPCTVELAGGLR